MAKRRTINRLTKREFDAWRKRPIGWLHDGGCLSFQSRNGNATGRVQLQFEGRERTLGIGDLGLDAARRRRDELRDAIRRGEDPTARKKAARGQLTFDGLAEEFIRVRLAGQSAIHIRNWSVGLRGKTPDGEKVDKGFHCAPIARKRISAISTDDVLAIVHPLWTGGQFPTADKLRGRLENVFGYAITKGHLPSDAANPAQWRGRLEFLLPSRKAMHRETNHAMVEWRDAPALVAAIRAREGICYRALQLLALTALRAGDARSLRAGDIDFGSMTLRVQKTKTGEPHDVPMAPAVADLLRPLIEGQAPGYRPFDVGEASLRQALARLPEAEGVTVHGWRACFRSWCAAKSVDDEAAESALAHKPRGIVSVYQREKMVERRRPVMEAWARHLNGNVTSLRAA